MVEAVVTPDPVPEPTLAEKLAVAILDVPDFPKKGIVFKDITPLFENIGLFQEVIAKMVNQVRLVEATKIVAIDARGFVFGAPVALTAWKPFVLARKPGKLPRDVVSKEYSLEYGKASLEIIGDTITKGDKIFIVDDLLATGGTAAATADLVTDLGAEVVGYGFVSELEFLEGRKKLTKAPVFSLVKF